MRDLIRQRAAKLPDLLGISKITRNASPLDSEMAFNRTASAFKERFPDQAEEVERRCSNPNWHVGRRCACDFMFNILFEEQLAGDPQEAA